MRNKYFLAVGTILGLALLAELYFATVFNESIRHALDIPAMLFVAPGLLFNRLLRLGLSFDGPNHTAVILLSALVYGGIAVVVIAVVQTTRNRKGQQGRCTERGRATAVCSSDATDRPRR